MLRTANPDSIKPVIPKELYQIKELIVRGEELLELREIIKRSIKNIPKYLDETLYLGECYYWQTFVLPQIRLQ